MAKRCQETDRFVKTFHALIPPHPLCKHFLSIFLAVFPSSFPLPVFPSCFFSRCSSPYSLSPITMTVTVGGGGAGQ